jgi:hypothetical protein
MPINPNALSAPQPDEPEKSPDAVASDGTELGQSGGAEPEAPKRKRRTKAELIADAVVPGLDDVVEVKDITTGAKIERPWRVAVEMFREKKVDWPDNVLKYAFMKYEQERATQAGGAFAQQPSGDPASQEPMGAAGTVESPGQTPSPDVGAHSGKPVDATDASGQRLAPEGAELGDEVVVGAETYVVGHGGVLVQGMVSNGNDPIIPKRRWQRELGSGPDGPWESHSLAGGSVTFSGPTGQATVPGTASAEEIANATKSSEPLSVETQRLPRTQEVLDDGALKIGTGVLEKIGMPDYSSFQVGPITMSRTVIDDGRRTTVTFDDGRQGEVITAAVEGFDLIDNTVEFVAKRFRGQLVSFLESTGALKQSVS